MCSWNSISICHPRLAFGDEYKFCIVLIFIVIVVFSGVFTLYMVYAYWLFGKGNGELQRRLCDTLLDRLEWDGEGKALDIGTGSGRIAIRLARRYPLAHIIGIDYWGGPWDYSKSICKRNAEVEGVSDRTSFQRASAITLPFEDGEYDSVVSNFVFHTPDFFPNNQKNSRVANGLGDVALT